jgi:hypothetical protein
VKAALFLTAEAGPAAALLAAWRARHPDARWTVFVRDELRKPLLRELAGCDVRRDKATGSRLAMLRGLRRERFDLLVVAWQGGRTEPLKVAAWLVGARQAVAVDERLREIELRWWWPWRPMVHGFRRLRTMPALGWLRSCCAFYRATVGWLLGSLWLCCWWAVARVQRAR